MRSARGSCRYHHATLAVPKKKQGRARTRKRRAQHKASTPRLNECPRCHSPRLPHRVCPTCGTYDGREIIRQEVPEAAPAEAPETAATPED
jgi:large subunit ribosomal protein L32